jgi:uncharacterized protein YjdB
METIRTIDGTYLHDSFMGARRQPLFTDEGPISWASFDEAVATVSADGLVTAVAEGEAKIQAVESRKTVFGVGEITVIVKGSADINVGGGDEAGQEEAE